MQAIRDKARHMRMPPDPQAAVADVLPEVEGWPDEVESKAVILDRIAPEVAACTDDAELRVLLTWLSANLENGRDDARTIREQQGARRGGSASKRRDWADELVAKLRRDSPKGGKAAIWESVPEADDPAIIETENGDFQVYRDGAALVAVDETGREHTLKKRTLEDNYL